MALEQSVAAFLGSDPIAGSKALRDLVAQGDAGEEKLFSERIHFPDNVQVRRRWLQYVATRKHALTPRLLNRMESQQAYGDANAIAFLFAGLEVDSQITRELFTQIKADIGKYSREGAMSRMAAYGYAGGDGASIWYLLKESGYAWEKLRVSAFRASCAAFARINTETSWSIEQLITHHGGPEELEKIGDSPDAKIPHYSIEGSEMWGEASHTFIAWRRGEVADVVLSDWSQHPHWRVRSFGAQILAGLGFLRTVTPILEWIRNEQLGKVRLDLLHALERSESPAGADVLLDHFNRTNGEGAMYLARVAWRANDRPQCVKVLTTLANSDDTVGAEALVALARMGQRHPKLNDSLDSPDNHRRLNAALAIAYLRDKDAPFRLKAMQGEAARPIERIYVAAALALLGAPGSALQLHRELITAADVSDFFLRVDLFFVHRYLQNAVLEGLEAGGAEAREICEAWRGELQPLEPVPRPVIASQADVYGMSRAAETKDRPLNVFISYSHRDEKMRNRLGEHLAQLEHDRLIRIWHDREIEAGADWEAQVNDEIGGADIILLLVSASFLKSQYCQKELQRALKLRSAEKSIPIPIILRDCDWTGVFNRKEYTIQALPRDNRVVAGTGWPNQDAAFAAIVRELRTKIERMRGGVSSVS